MIIDLFIAIFAVVMIVFSVKKQLKSYKKDEISAFCAGNCTSCKKNCSVKKS